MHRLFDSDPCRVAEAMLRSQVAPSAMAAADASAQEQEAKALGVRIEARYSVGEYDILILSAQESDGLVTWLTRNGYRIPAGASQVVRSYLARDMRFFVAKVNLDQHARSRAQRLRPLQIAYESPRFMLPIRLGMVNARGHQELFVYTLTRHGRVETSNYRTLRLPTGQQIPVQMKERFDFQGRYVIRHAYAGASRCEAGQHYRNVLLPQRLEQERETLARLTGWTPSRIAERVPMAVTVPDTAPWWERIWIR